MQYRTTKWFHLAFCVALAGGGNCVVAEAQGKALTPPSIRGDQSESIPRQGTAIRYGAHLLGSGHFKVCDVSFYAAHKTAYADLVQGKAICAVSYSYVRDISKDDYGPRWLQKLLDGGLAKDKATALVKLLPAANINNGDVLELLWYPTKTFIVRYNGKESGRLTDDETAIAVLTGLLGPDGPWGVPESILGARPKQGAAKPTKSGR